jgi:uncharacterized membrane protein
MDAMSWVDVISRWAHVVAGVLWIGLLYFFNWVNGSVAAKLDADTKRKVLPELLPRTLYFFRWGAAYTWVTGVLLLGVVYYSRPGLMTSGDSHGMAVGVGFVSLLVGAAIYDILWKTVLKQGLVGTSVSLALVVAYMAALQYGLGLTPRALFIHVGALFGTAMAMNVWMRIWPAQRKIIAAVKAGEAPPEGLPALAGMRSKHNTYMSVPLIFTMVSQHFYGVLGFKGDLGWVVLTVVIVIGWIVTKLIYDKAAGEAPTRY